MFDLINYSAATTHTTHFNEVGCFFINNQTIFKMTVYNYLLKKRKWRTEHPPANRITYTNPFSHGNL